MSQSIFPETELQSLQDDFSCDDKLLLKFDQNAKLINLTPQWEAVSGFQKNELLNTSFQTLLSADSQVLFSDFFEQLKSDGFLLKVPLKLQQKNGCAFDVLMMAKTITDGKQTNYVAECRTLEYYMHSVKAIEELLIKERFLSKSHQLRADIAELALVAKNAPDFLKAIEMLFNKQSELTLIATKRIKTTTTPHRPVEISNTTIQKSVANSANQKSLFSESLPFVETTVQVLIGCPNPAQTHYQFSLVLNCHETLVTAWLETLEESFTQIYASIEHLHAQFELTKTQNQLQTLVENVHAIGFEVDLHKQTFNYVSPKLMDILGYQVKEWHATDQWLALIHNEDRLKIKRIFDHSTNATEIANNQHFSFRIRHKNGQFIWVLAHTTLQKSEDGSPSILGVLIDISEQKTIEASLEAAVKEANHLTQEQQTFLSLFDMGDIVLFKWRNNENWNVDYVSLSVERLLGFTPEEFTQGGKLYANCIHPHDLSRVLSEVENAIETNQTFFRHQPYRIVDIHNQVKWVSDITYILRDSSHEIVNFIGYVYDVTLEHDSHTQLQSILDMQESIIIVTNGRKIQFANKRFLNFFNEPDLNAFLAHSSCICDYFVAYKGHYVKPNERTDWLYDLAKLPESKRIVALERGRDTIGSFKVQINQLTDLTSVVSFTDITETLREKDYFQYLSHHDRLTGSYNREYLHHRFEKLIAATKRNNQHLGLILIDIDHFKQINDTHGHNLGDDVLKALAEMIQENIRIHDRLIRWGGEEFILVAEVDSIESAAALAEHMRYLTEQKRFPKSLNITASFGITLVDDNETLKSAIERADLALYRAKNAGRNQVEIEI